MTELNTPPPGWMPFGAHSNMTPAPPLEFSPERAPDGMPRWERCTHLALTPDEIGALLALVDRIQDRLETDLSGATLRAGG